MHAAALQQQQHLLLLLRGWVRVRVQELSPETATKCTGLRWRYLGSVSSFALQKISVLRLQGRKMRERARRHVTHTQAMSSRGNSLLQMRCMSP